MRLTLSTEHRLIPAVSPTGVGAPGRTHATTQVLVDVDCWPGSRFRLWAPEHAGSVWSHTQPDTARQSFTRDGHALRWHYRAADGAWVASRLLPGDGLLTLDVVIGNGSDRPLDRVGVANCLQMSTAPDFACDDLSRLFVRVEGRWQRLAELRPSSGYPHYPLANRRAAGGRVVWGGDLTHLFEPVAVDHPLMVCVSRDGNRSVGTASADADHLFHNRANPRLLCIHSAQAISDGVPPGATVLHRQRIYFADGGVDACVERYRFDPPDVQPAAGKTGPGR